MTAKKVAAVRLDKHRWLGLEPGDVVDVIAPSSGSSKKEFKDAIKFLVKFGLTPRYPRDILGKDILCANTDKKRFQYLKDAIQTKDSKAIWCLRGGYGSARLLPELNKLRKPAHCKLFIGYSDTTALHTFFINKWDWSTLHGTMLEELGRGEGGQREIADFQNILFRRKTEIEYNKLKAMNQIAKDKRVINSKCVGGNLAIIEASIGTPWQFNGKGKIVIIEDIGERGYRIDRMLVHLEQAGIFKGVKALVFGDFVGGEENQEEDCVYLWRDVQKRFAKDAKFPVYKGLAFGHGPFQRPVPFNTKSQLILGRSGKLKIQY